MGPQRITHVDGSVDDCIGSLGYLEVIGARRMHLSGYQWFDACSAQATRDGRASHEVGAPRSSDVVFFVVEPFARPCARSTTAARRRDLGRLPDCRTSRRIRCDILSQSRKVKRPCGVEHFSRSLQGSNACVERVTTGVTRALRG